MKPEDFKIHDFIDSLMGTCAMLSEKLPDGMSEDDLTDEDHETIDGEIFNCDTCGWWCEICEQDADGNCQDCSESAAEGGDDE